MKLISLIEFVLEKNEVGLFKYNDEKIRRYAEFLSQELTLSMFLPCDKNDNLIDEPSCFSHFMNGEITRMGVKITNRTLEDMGVDTWEEVTCDSSMHSVSGSFYTDKRIAYMCSTQELNFKLNNKCLLAYCTYTLL